MKGWFSGWSSRAASPNVDAEQTYDLIPEITAPGQAKSEVVMYRRPGLTLFGTAGTGPHRSSCEQNGRVFVLSGSKFYEAFADQTFTDRGNVAFSSEPGSVCGNGTGGHQVFVVSGGLGYIFDTVTDILTQITDPDFPADPVMGFFINGHFGVIVRDSREFAISAPFDGTTWSALDLGEKTRTVDSLVAAVVDWDQGEVWLIGSRTSEVWWYSGAASFPLEPIPNRIVPMGSGAAFSWIDIGGTIYGLGESKDGGHVVVRFRGGYTPERISTHALEAEIQTYDIVSDAQACSLEWRGHRFYILTFPSADVTHVYDEATGGWTQWSYWDVSAGARKAFLGQGHVYAFGKHLVGSRTDGSFYELSQVYSDAGTPMRSQRDAAYLASSPHRLRHTRLSIDVERGVGLVSGQGSDPQLMVQWSDDGGHTWSAEEWIGLGAIGQYGGRTELRRLGLAGEGGRIYRVVVTDPVVVALIDADVEVMAVA